MNIIVLNIIISFSCAFITYVCFHKLMNFRKNRTLKHKIYSEWRRRNPHNKTEYSKFNLPSIDEINNIKVGKMTYGKLNIINTSPDNPELKIGNYCSIAEDVVFLLGSEHKTNTISTYPFHHHFENKIEAFTKGNIEIGDDVWIGYGAKILSGVKIGQGAVIASSALVASDVEPYSIVGGIPAKHIKYRFSETTIKKLLQVDLVKLYDSFTKEDLDKIYSPLSDELLDDFIRKFAK